MKHSWGDGTTYWKDEGMTPEELAYHLRECEAPPGFCPVCDIVKAARIQALEEAARCAELDAGWDSVNCIQDDFNYSQEHKAISRRIAAAIRALKD